MVGFDLQLGMIGAEMPGHRACVLRLVEGLIAKSDRIGADRPVALRLHQRHHRRRVDPAGEEGAQRHIGNEAAADGVLEQRLEPVNGLGVGQLQALVDCPPHHRARVPIEFDARRGARGEREGRPRRQLVHVAIDAGGAGDVAVAQIARYCVAVDLGPPARMGAQGLELRAPQE